MTSNVIIIGDEMKIDEQTVLFKHLAGSKLYGTDLPESDTDFKIVFIPSPREILLGRTTSASQSTTGDDKGKNTSEDEDVTRVSIQKFLALCAKGDMGSMETLFADSNKDAVIFKHDLWDGIIENRTELVSKNMRSAFGYAKSQTSKYIVRGDRKSNVDNIITILSKYKVGDKVRLAKNEIEECIDSFEFTCFETNKLNDEYINVCERKFPLNGKVGDALSVFKKLQDEYGQRTRAAQNLGGKDWKGIMHSERVICQAIEFLESGCITFPSTNGDYLKDVRRGIVPVEQVTENLNLAMNRLSYLEGNVKCEYKTSLAENISMKMHSKVLMDYFGE